ncbi:MAG: superoxide dismutase family protein [Cyclobacteriaceae bacterium]
MRNITLILLAFLVSCSSDDETIVPPGPITPATADINFVTSDDGENYTKGELMGNVNVQFQDGITTMVISVTNMEPNSSHAMHLHMGSLEVPGRHWNQNVLTAFCNEESMGSVWAKPFAGDVGNIEIDENGNGSFTIQTDLWTLGEGEDSDIENTVLFIHQSEEDFLNECDPNHGHTHGHVNAKIAGGTIVLGTVIQP